MIQPHEYLDLDNSVINISGLIVQQLLGTGVMKYDELYTRVKLIGGLGAKNVYIYALDFLFLLGKIRYSREADTLELIK